MNFDVQTEKVDDSTYVIALGARSGVIARSEVPSVLTGYGPADQVAATASWVS